MVTRRRFLARGAAAVASSLIGPMGARAQELRFETALPIPELRDARAGNGLIQLVAAEGRHAFVPGSPTKTSGFSAPYLGSVLRLRKGDEVQITVENRLDRAGPVAHDLHAAGDARDTVHVPLPHPGARGRRHDFGCP